jgi:hypothetical protein
VPFNSLSVSLSLSLSLSLSVSRFLSLSLSLSLSLALSLSLSLSLPPSRCRVTVVHALFRFFFWGATLVYSLLTCFFFSSSAPAAAGSGGEERRGRAGDGSERGGAGALRKLHSLGPPLSLPPPRVVVCGHSHKAFVCVDNGRLFVNPGAEHIL